MGILEKYNVRVFFKTYMGKDYIVLSLALIFNEMNAGSFHEGTYRPLSFNYS